MVRAALLALCALLFAAPAFAASCPGGQFMTGTNPMACATASGTGGTVTNVTGTTNQVSVTNPTTTPVISLTGPYSATTYTAHALLVGEGSSGIAAVACADARVLLGQSGVDPACVALSGDCTIADTGVLTCSIPANHVTGLNAIATGGVTGGGAQSNKFVSAISGTGAATLTQPDFTNLSGAATNAQLPTVSVAHGGTQCTGPSTFAGLPGSPTAGEICFVTDATTCTAGTPVAAGGGSTKCQVTYDGTNWNPGGGVTSAASGGVTAVNASAPITSSGGTTPTIAITEPLTGNAVTLAGDTSGASNSNQTTVTHLAAPLPVAQGGTQCVGPSTFAGLPGSPTKGEVCFVTNAPSCVAGTPVTAGGGSTQCQVTYDGTNWQPGGGVTSAASGGIASISVTAPIASTGGTTPTLSLTEPLTGNAVTLAGDTSGASNSNQTTATHLASPLPVAQGGRQCGAPVVFASLPGSPTNGEICDVTDANACAAGTTISSGGGSTKCQVTYDGSNWRTAGGATAVTSVGATAPVTSSGGATPTIALTTPLTGNAVTLAGDTSGASNSNQVTVTHLASALPVAQGGTQCGAPVVFASLPGAPTKGEICFVTDASTCTAGTAVTAGGGVNQCQVTWDGSNWQPGGGVSSAAAGGVTAVNATAPITSSGGTTPTIAITTPLTGNAVTLAGDTSGASNANQTTVTHLASALPVAQGGRQCGAPTVFASLPGAPTNGEICNVTDANSCVAGTNVTSGGGSTKCEVTYDGTNWRPAGGATSPVTNVTASAPIVSSGGATPNLTLTTPLTGNAVTLAGDTSGASNANQTTATHLASPLPVAQGGRQCGAPVAFASLPGAPTNGEICDVTDATQCVAGTAVTAGGSTFKCQVTYNGTNWFPAGGATSPVGPQSLGFFYGGTPNSTTVEAFTCPTTLTFPANFAASGGTPASVVSCGINPTGAPDTYTVFIGGPAAGTISVSTSCVATFATTGGVAQNCTAGQRLSVVPNGTPTGANTAISLVHNP